MNERDLKSLQARFKRMLRAIRNFSAWENANTRGTGGGRPDVNSSPDTEGITITGSLLSLRQKFGIGVCGLPPMGSDSLGLPPPVFGGIHICYLSYNMYFIILFASY